MPARPGTVLEGERLRRSGGGGGCPRAAPSAPAVPSRPGQAAPPGAAARGDGPGGHRRRETARRAGVSAGARHRLPPPLPPPSIPATSGPPGGGEPRGGGGERAAGFWRETGAVGAGKPAEPLGGLTPIAGPRRPPSPRPGPGGPRLPAAPALRTGAWRGGRLVATPPRPPIPAVPRPQPALRRVPPLWGCPPLREAVPAGGGWGGCPRVRGCRPGSRHPASPPPPGFGGSLARSKAGARGRGARGPALLPAPSRVPSAPLDRAGEGGRRRLGPFWRERGQRRCPYPRTPPRLSRCAPGLAEASPVPSRLGSARRSQRRPPPPRSLQIGAEPARRERGRRRAARHGPSRQVWGTGGEILPEGDAAPAERMSVWVPGGCRV